jgi:hypothetical protein
MDLTRLVDLPVLPLRIAAVALDPLEMPEHGSSRLRGAFGASLKQLVCVRTELRDCAPCPLLSECAYPTLFEPRLPEAVPGMVGLSDLPRPYVLRADPEEQGAAPGETLTWQGALIGRATAMFPYFVMTWQAMGQQGIGAKRGRFELVGVESLGLDHHAAQLLYDRESNRVRTPTRTLVHEHLARWAAAWTKEPACGLEVQFQTPMRIKHRGESVSVPEFPLLWRNLQRRLSLLRLAHGGGRPEVDFEESIRHAESVRLTFWNGGEASWRRYSRKQGRHVPMSGLVGIARYAGDLTPFLAPLKLGEFLGVGDNCTFGQGQYRISVSQIPL